MRLPLIVVLLLSLGLPTVIHAQEPVIVIGPGNERENQRAAAQAVRIFNRSSTTRIFGSHTIRRSELYRGDVGVWNGVLVVSGIIRGDLAAVDADVRLASSASVDGDVLILGGTLDRSAGARVGGVTRQYTGSFDIRRVGDELELVSPPPTYIRISSRQRFRPRRSYSDASLVLGIGPTYNRVEGLPIHFGPRITWTNEWSSRLRLEALGIYRTTADLENVFDSSLARTDVGYSATGELELGGSREVTVGGRVFDVVAPIEDWQLHDDEVSLATLLLHRDYRDYYLTRGWTVYGDIRPTDELTLSGAYSREEQTSIAARNPWTVARRDEGWRANPAIDEGDFTIISAAAEFDSRGSERYYGAGWFIRAEWERGSSDNVADRGLPVAIREPLPTSGEYIYDRYFVDFRRYERVGWSGQLSVRGVVAGTLGEHDALPVQRRLSLGHVMPGYGFRSFACNEAVADPSSPALCDNIVLIQAEYRADLSIGRWTERDRRSRGRERGSSRSRHDPRGWGDWDDWFWFDGPSLVVFGDAGTGWLRGREIGDLQFDVGVGLEFGGAGIYASRPISSDGKIRVGVRLNRRF